MLTPMARTLAVLALVGLMGAGCSKKEEAPPAVEPAAPAPAPVAQDLVNIPVAFQTVTLGNQIGEDKQVAMPASSFTSSDTIYASVATAGTGKAMLKAVWTYRMGDQVTLVNETMQELDTAGPATTEFHINKPDGWPVGQYRVEIFMNDLLVGSQDYEVK